MNSVRIGLQRVSWLVSVSRGVKVWVFVSFCSLLIWIVYSFPSNIDHFLKIASGKPDYYTSNLGMFLAYGVGLVARFFGVILALAAGFLLWGGNGVYSGSRAVRFVEAALFLEGTFFVLLFPSGLWWIGLGPNFVGVGYLLQAVSAGTALLVLSFKVRDFGRDVSVLKWIGVAAVGYVGALWFNVVFGWFDMIEVIGSSFLLRGATSWGFLGSLVTMTLAVFFAVVGAYLLAGNNGDSVWWFGLSLAMVGLHYVIYLGYAFSVGDFDSAMQLDVWTLPFLGLGLSMLLTKVTKHIIELPTATNPTQEKQ